MNGLANIFIYAAVFAAQYLLSLTSHKWLSLIVPVFFTIFMIYQVNAQILSPLTAVLITIVMYLFLYGQFRTAQKNKEQKQKSELNKMKSKDI
ncbi:hypothetical protein ERX37_01210 [Macrococcus hajekii]|uniref:Uncharacterized protein n=1 Tax=Macrococcus hajekii TaxID=198482 RepID=A0A4R6BM06_9STAP|nr:hypothetical protein [Macrococcus hajekii]TDM02738.1 hypothetical protein ERX37_01210 [Macrococcus hajekii]GGB03470.1 hypothetical protein GCM10007190_09360 [Macrococcus hajekii]